MSTSSFSTHLLDAALRADRERRESVRKEMLRRLVDALSMAPARLDEAYVFGSLVRPYAFGDTSDIDVAVHGVPPRTCFDLKRHLEEKTGREVDLIEIESCRFFASIRRQGIQWTRPRS